MVDEYKCPYENNKLPFKEKAKLIQVSSGTYICSIALDIKKEVEEGKYSFDGNLKGLLTVSGCPSSVKAIGLVPEAEKCPYLRNLNSNQQ